METVQQQSQELLTVVLPEPGELLVTGGQDLLEFVWLDHAELPTVDLLDQTGELSADRQTGVALVILLDLVLLAVQLGVGVEVEEVLHQAGTGEETLEAAVHVAGVAEVPQAAHRGQSALVRQVPGLVTGLLVEEAGRQRVLVASVGGRVGQGPVGWQDGAGEG